MWRCRRGWTSGDILCGGKRIERFGYWAILQLKTSQRALVGNDNSATCCLGWYLSDCVGLIHLIANPVSITAEEKQPGSRVAYWALAVVFLVVYVGSMFTPGLLDDADSTHAEAAREMVVTGDYVTLHVNGVRYLEKAPLPYWLVAFGYEVLGVNEFSTRLPMVLSVMPLMPPPEPIA